MVNAIPDTATLESYVRGASFEAMAQTNKKVNRALCGAALSLGANVDIQDHPGYAPLICDYEMMNVSKEAADSVLPDENFIIYDVMESGSTDMGDLCSIMPVVHPYAAGAKGTSHGRDYYIEDPERACVSSAKMQLAMMKILLSDDAKRAKEIVSNYKAPFASKQEYLDFMDSLNSSGDRIEYKDDEAKVRL